ncbi:MAG: hypothetical protein ABII22_03305 [Candidatus Micrarchaeota archaeon]
MILTCTRCGIQTPKLEKCNPCDTLICYSCMKSAKKVARKKYCICKTCWGKMSVRTKFKSLGARQI